MKDTEDVNCEAIAVAVHEAAPPVPLSGGVVMKEEVPSSEEVFVGIGMLILEGRVPGLTKRGYGEGPHINPLSRHACEQHSFLCERRKRFEAYMVLLWENAISMSVEVLLAPDCQHGKQKAEQAEPSTQPDPSFVLLEQWTVQMVAPSLYCSPETLMTDRSLFLALRSYLHFSQLSAWFSQSGGTRPANVLFRITVPGEQFASNFPLWASPDLHRFPVANVGKKDAIKVTVRSLPRRNQVPVVICSQKQEGAEASFQSIHPNESEDDDVLCGSQNVGCRQTGKHLCSDVPVQVDEYPPPPKFGDPERGRRVKKKLNGCEDTMTHTEMDNLLRSLRERQQPPCGKRTPRERSPVVKMSTSKSTPGCGTHHFLDSIMRRRGFEPDDCQTYLPKKSKQLSCQKSIADCHCSTNKPKENVKFSVGCEDLNDIDLMSVSLKRLCFQDRTKKRVCEPQSDLTKCSVRTKGSVVRVLDFSEKQDQQGNNFIQQRLDEKLTTQEVLRPVPPTAAATVEFRKSLDSAIGMVFHQRTGLPLTSSPAPLRRGTAFNYDSSLNSPHAIKSALLEGQGGGKSCVPIVTSSCLLGNFEESVLNGRLEPVSTVPGFTAEIGASGQFQPAHITVPVTVFFYSLCNSQQLSSPYLAHINLGKRGYRVPNTGTIQVTLFNPHGTVVKMWVVSYNLSDMPALSQTFIRQRTLYMPLGSADHHPDSHQWLRYLIHLRFHTSKSGKLYLHTDIRMIIFRKSDVDAATLHRGSVPYELRSFTHQPVNPKYSPRR